MREGVTLEQEHQSILDPELHQPYPEKVDAAVSGWVGRGHQIENFSDADLEHWQDEFSLVEQERLEPHPINIRTFEHISAVFSEKANLSAEPQVTQVATRLSNLVVVIRKAIDEYASAVRYHSRASELANIQENGPTRLNNANSLRLQAHEHLIDALTTHRRALTTDIPEQLGAERKAKLGWKNIIANAVFDMSEISNKGIAREKIGYWALDMDIAIKATAIRTTLTNEAEKRKRTLLD